MSSSSSSSPQLPHCDRTVRWRLHLGLLSSAAAATAEGEEEASPSPPWNEEVRRGRRLFRQLERRHPLPPGGTTAAGENGDCGAVAAEASSRSEAVTTTSAAAAAAAAESEPADSAIDPLTAMVLSQEQSERRRQELDLQYRRDRARRARKRAATAAAAVGGPSERQHRQQRALFGEEEDEAVGAEETLQLIDKDLARLPPPPQRSAGGTAITAENRRRILRRVLFVYASTHESSGYLQGMHEVASHVLAALELEAAGRTAEGEQEEEEASSTTAADCYTLTAHLLENLGPAYDVAVLQDGSGSAGVKPLAATCDRILDVVAVHRPETASLLRSSHVPPTLLFAKWLRLLFSREVAGSGSGAEEGDDYLPVLRLWDDIFAVTAQHRVSLLETAEALAAARILRHGVLNQTVQQPPLGGQQQQQQQQQHYWFLNLAPETDLKSWMETARALLAYEKNPQTVISLPTPPPPPRPMPPSNSAAPIQTPQRPISFVPQQHAGTVPGRSTSAVGLFSTPQQPGDLVATTTRFSFSNVKEQLASRTKSIQKALVQEWENLNNPNLDHQPPDTSGRRGERRSSSEDYDDAQYNLDYHPRYDDPLRGYDPSASSLAAAASANRQEYHDRQRNRHHPHRSSAASKETSQQEPPWAVRLQSRLSTLQDFVTGLQRQGLPVPPQVWEALADLQVLQQDMMRQDGRS